MAIRRSETTLAFLSPEGLLVANLKLASEADERLEVLRTIPREEAFEFGEETTQLLEGETYQYELDRPGYRVEHTPGIVERFLVGAESIDRGSITPGLRTGSLRLRLMHNGERCASVAVEVRSRKVGYRDDYRAMLQEIASASVDLLLQITSPSELRLTHSETEDTETLMQRFFFVRGLLESAEFVQAVQQILRNPHNILRNRENVIGLGQNIPADPRIMLQIASRQPRTSLPEAHPLAEKLASLGFDRPSLPETFAVNSHEETVDTVENRFVKYALTSFAVFLADTDAALRKRGEATTAVAEREVLPMRQQIEEIISDDFFADISDMTFFPLSSPVLQRKSGYREVLHAWIRFQAAARLAWKGGEDVYGAGKRDIAALYEYWLFFVLWEIVRSWSPANSAGDLRSVLKPAADGFSLALKRGELLEPAGFRINRSSKNIRVQFNYNRTFHAGQTDTLQARLSYRRSYPSAGSWTRKMRPDFTISFWPDGKSREDAELTEQIVHIHFDAKYSVAKLRELFGSETDDLEKLKQQENSGTFQRGDLLKMHSYRDAIRRSEGAYILFPGLESDSTQEHEPEYHAWLGFQEILPGLGAFAIRPGRDREASIAHVRNFLEDVLDHMASDNTVREKIARATFTFNRPPANGN